MLDLASDTLFRSCSTEFQSLLNSLSFEYSIDRDLDDNDEKILVADIRKVQNLTGWVPSPNIERTAESILEWWREEIRLRY